MQKNQNSDFIFIFSSVEYQQEFRIQRKGFLIFYAKMSKPVLNVQ